MAGELEGRRVAILAADGVERVELEQPRRALDDAGARTAVVSITSGTIAAQLKRVGSHSGGMLPVTFASR